MPPIDYVFAGHCPEFERMGQPVVVHEVAKDCKKCLELWQLPPTDLPTGLEPGWHARQQLPLNGSQSASSPASHAEDSTDGWTMGRPHPSSHLAQSAKWAAYGIDTNTARYRGELTSFAMIASEMLGLQVCQTASHRNTLRPAPLVGAFARWLDRHVHQSDKLKAAATHYWHCADETLRGHDIEGTWPMIVLAKWVNSATTSGLDSKKEIYRATCAAIAAHVAGRHILTRADLDEAAKSASEPIP